MKTSYPLNKQFMLIGMLLLKMLAVSAADRIGLENFSAKWEKNQVVLKWTAAVEQNFSHFAIERSVNGEEFKEVALYFTEGDPRLKCSYAYTDKFLPNKNKFLYYRLRLINKDGTIQYSSPQQVSLEAAETMRLRLYPNPVQRTVVAAIPQQWNQQEVLLELYNGNGQLLKTRIEKRASVTLSMDLDDLAPGWYILKARTAAESIHARLVKIK
ncbi:T9SS type A sorting domain-containing protein [Flavihumibacter sp. RY-1]|uniref:T9SS type A sorting domain-containing protein n=1 Tax=Flavihumibacter fluminis TaxID=2909236 RepID=A0ABS9BKL7_9BACT|nr:T9SS type A sorting domain-containing protein [Flavihumibacter fluminis]MCF1716234.1 T9SS type A sorting domain-containing protein [Flavihumibacter fluminis]